MTKGYEAQKRRELDKEINDAKIKQSEKESKRAFVGNIIGAATGGLSRFIPGMYKADIRGVAPKVTHGNDPQWYKRWISDVDRFISLPQFKNLKSEIPGAGIILKTSGTTQKYSLPGVVSFRYIPYLGIDALLSTGGNAYERCPINIALARDISQIRKANSRSVSRNPDELGFYWLAAVEIATMLADLHTALTIVMTYNPSNTFLPSTLLRAKGWNPTMVSENRADLIKMYQEYATRFNSNIVIPSDLTLLKRRVWLASVVLQDAELRMGQLYTFSPIRCLKMDMDEDKLSPSFVEYSSNGIKASLGNLRTWFTQAFQVLEESTTMIDLVADIRSAVPESKFAKLPVEISNEPYIFKADHSVLLQIHNLTTLPCDSNGTILADTDINNLSTVHTDGTYLYCADGCSTNNTSAPIAGAKQAAFEELYGVNSAQAIDGYSPILSGDDILEATRFKLVYESLISGTTPTTTLHTIKSAGTELIVSERIFYNLISTGQEQTLDLASASGRTTTAITLMSACDWHPIMYDTNLTDSNNYRINPIGEFGNVFNINYTELAPIHDVCIQSLVYLPDDVFSAAFGK